jgi:hypothetical protein
LVPLYDTYHVDLVLQGHDHVYARTKRLAGGKEVGPADPGTIYVVSVSGPRMYPFNPRFASIMAKTQSDTQMYQVIEIDGDCLQYEAYSVGGTLVDAFEIRKGPQCAAVCADSSAAVGLATTK